MTTQPAMFGTHVDEMNIYIGVVRDDGTRTVFMSICCNHKRHQTTKVVPDYVQTDDLIAAVGIVAFNVETGFIRPHEIGVDLEAALAAAEADPF